MFDSIEYHEDYGWVCLCDEEDEWFFGCCFIYTGKGEESAFSSDEFGIQH